MRRIIKIIITTIFWFLLQAGHIVYAQIDALYRAQKLYYEKQPEIARNAIDSAAFHPETSRLPETHTIRAFIYYELFKKNQKNLPDSPLRDTIVKSLLTSENLKPDSSYHNNNVKLLYNISVNYYSLANQIFNEKRDDVLSEKLFSKYKELAALADPTINLKAKDVEFYNMLGSHYASEFISKIDKNNVIDKTLSQKATLYHLKVLQLDPENFRANLNLGLMNYSESVYLIKNMDAATDLGQLDVIQENVTKLAKKAENFVLKAYQTDPKNKICVEALYYIYRALFEKEKYTEYQKKCKELGIPIQTENNK